MPSAELREEFILGGEAFRLASYNQQLQMIDRDSEVIKPVSVQDQLMN